MIHDIIASLWRHTPLMEAASSDYTKRFHDHDFALLKRIVTPELADYIEQHNDGTYHIQRLTTGDGTAYAVVWLADHWRESFARRYELLNIRDQRHADLARREQRLARHQRMFDKWITACQLEASRKGAQQLWRTVIQYGTEESIRTFLAAYEQQLNTSIYEPPATDEV